MRGTDGLTKGRIAMLRGDSVYLTALDPDNSEISRGWMNDPEVNRWLLEGHIPISKASEAGFYARMESSPTDYVYEIHVAQDGRYVGNCGLNDVDIRHGHAEVGIVIGEKADQNRGFGRDAIRTLIRFGFDTLRLHRIEIRAAGGNDRATHLYRSIGFKDVGLLREHTFTDGVFENEVVLDMLEGEWRALP